MVFGLDTVLVALIGAAATIYGIREARAGRRDALIQQAAANTLAKEKQELDTLREVIAATEREADRASHARDEARKEADEERARRVEIETELRDEVKRERTARVEAETAVRLSEEQLRRQGQRHATEVAELVAVLREDIHREAGRTELAIEIAEEMK